MSIGLIVFIIYLVIMVFSRRQQQAKKSSNSMKKQRNSLNSNELTFIPDRIKYVKNINNIEKTNDTEKEEIILINDEIEDFYDKKEIKKSIEKLPVENKEKQNSNKIEVLQPYFHDNPLINGIILSELIALPRSLKPYTSRRYNK